MSKRRNRVPTKRKVAQDAGYRSALEHRVAVAAEEQGIDFEYEPEDGVIEWVPKPKKYLPDFVLPNGVIVEVKGRLTVHDRVKHLSIKEQHPKKDVRFVFQFDNKLNRASKTRYSEWCEKHGFKYAFGEIPGEWANEE